jgi:hypothetical protein
MNSNLQDIEVELKQELIGAIAKVSDADFRLAADRWLSGFNAEGMLKNFISIINEYSE